MPRVGAISHGAHLLRINPFVQPPCVPSNSNSRLSSGRRFRQGFGRESRSAAVAGFDGKQTVFLMMSRLLVDKGVREYVEAVKIVRSEFPDVIFQLAGDLDENPESIGLQELKSWIDQGDIQYLGQIKSVQSILKNCKFFVLPSYREGTPRSTLEALATGRPVITTDVPGCRETVIHKKNGLLVPSKDHVALANAMINLINEKDENIKKMSKQSFFIAKNKYEINKVNQSIIDIIGL